MAGRAAFGRDHAVPAGERGVDAAGRQDHQPNGPKADIVLLGAFTMAAGVLGIGFAASYQASLAGVRGDGGSAGRRCPAAAMAAMIAPWFEKHQGRAVSLARRRRQCRRCRRRTSAPVRHRAISGLVFDVDSLLLLAIVICARARSRLRHEALAAGTRAVSRRCGVCERRRQEMSPTWTVSAAARSPALWTVTVAFSIGMFVQVGFLTHQVTLPLRPSCRRR